MPARPPMPDSGAPIPVSAVVGRRAVLALVASLAAGGRPVAAQSAAAAYPSRPVRLVVPFAAGSGTDFVARILSEELQSELGVAIVVDNRPGANGTIGSDFVAKAPPDGHTLVLGGTSTHASAPSLFRSLPYDVERDFEPIAGVVETQFVLVVRGDAPLQGVRELAAALEARRGRAAFAYGSATTQIAGAGFARRMNLAVTPVPYKSNPQAMTDLLGGIVDFMFIDQTTALPQVAAGKLRALAVAAPRRMPELPAVPTLAEAGLGDFAVQTYVCVFAPARLPAPVAERLQSAMARIMAKPAVRSRLAPSGHPMAPVPRAELLAYLRSQREAWASKVRDAGLQPE